MLHRWRSASARRGGEDAEVGSFMMAAASPGNWFGGLTDGGGLKV
jgi:hypothetical protein